MAPINLGVQQVIAQGVTRNESLLSLPLEESLTQEHHDLWRGVQYAMADSYSANYDFWRGTQPTSRMATAVSAFVLNVIAVALVGILAILTVFWHAVFFMSWIFLPVAGAIAAFPPARRILKANIGIMIQAIFLRNVFGLVLALLLAVLNALNLGDGRLAMKVFLMLVAAGALWKVLSSIRAGIMAPTVTSWATQGPAPGEQVEERLARGGATAMRFSAGAAGVAAVRTTRASEGYRRYTDLSAPALRPRGSASAERADTGNMQATRVERGDAAAQDELGRQRVDQSAAAQAMRRGRRMPDGGRSAGADSSDRATDRNRGNEE